MKIVEVDGRYFVSNAEDILNVIKSHDEKTIIIKLKNKLESDVTIKFATPRECEEVFQMILTQVKSAR
ncbi:hypothetical protein EOM09_08620 [bacterium]|nr:hypothetical protein [bacterium]